MKEITMSITLVKSDSNALEVASILSIGSIILCFLTTLVNESHCEFVIGTLVGIMVGSSIRTIYSSALKSDGSRRTDKNDRIPSRTSSRWLIVAFGIATLAGLSNRMHAASQRRRWIPAESSLKQEASLMRHNSTANDSPLGDNARISMTTNANKQKLDEGLEL